jgi:molybdenum cofactor cytidylyltransferase
VTITLGDQPLIDAEVIRRVVSLWRRAPTRQGAVAATYEDGRGHPVLFGASLFPALRALDGDRGARALLASLGDAVALVDVPGTQPVDVDTPEALAELARRLGRTR